jgi:hypothetical protein
MSEPTGPTNVDVTPAWEAVVPIIVHCLQNPDVSADNQKLIQFELNRMAALADIAAKWIPILKDQADILAASRDETRLSTSNRATWIRLRDELNDHIVSYRSRFMAPSQPKAEE